MQFSDQMAKRFLVKWKIPVTDVCSGWTSALLLLWNWLCWNVFTVRWYGCSCHKQDCSKLVWPWSAADPLGIKEAWSEIPAVKYFAFRNMSSRHFFNADRFFSIYLILYRPHGLSYYVGRVEKLLCYGGCALGSWRTTGIWIYCLPEFLYFGRALQRCFQKIVFVRFFMGLTQVALRAELTKKAKSQGLKWPVGGEGDKLFIYIYIFSLGKYRFQVEKRLDLCRQ